MYPVYFGHRLEMIKIISRETWLFMKIKINNRFNLCNNTKKITMKNKKKIKMRKFRD